MRATSTMARLLPAVLAVALLAGCTEEKAQALRAAAEAFRAKSASAIDAVVELNLRHALGRGQSDEVLIERTRAELVRVQRIAPANINQTLSTSFDWVTDREVERRRNYANYDDLKRVYAEFAASFEHLPQGSLFAARDVSCSAHLAARLVGYMATAAKQHAANPVGLDYEAIESRKAIAAAAPLAVSSGNEQPLETMVRAHVALLKEERAANDAVVGKIADAAESGAVVLDLIERYDQVSVAEAVGAVRRVLVVREGFVPSGQAQVAQLDDILAKLNAKPDTAAVLQLPLGQRPTDCK